MDSIKEYKKKYYFAHKTSNRLRYIWNGMKSRCRPGHKYYGDQGISVCDEWLDFDVFKSWALNNGYDDTLTIDRINNVLGYSPDNCRWVTRSQQQRNTSYNVNLTFNGETHCIREWAEILGFSEHALRNRIRRGWNTERALTENVKIHRKKEII